MTLGRALIPLFDGDGREEAIDALQSIVQEEYPAVLKASMDEMRRAKLGIAVWDDGADALWKALRPLMAKSAVDFVIFFRQLAAITNADAAAAAGLSDDAAAADVLLERVSPSFYSEESAREAQGEWREWFAAYARRLAADGRPDGERSAEIRRTSPKYTPREWMLAEAYRAALARLAEPRERERARDQRRQQHDEKQEGELAQVVGGAVRLRLRGADRPAPLVARHDVE